LQARWRLQSTVGEGGHQGGSADARRGTRHGACRSSRCRTSERKALYIVDLATHFRDGRLTEELLQTASDEELVKALTAVKGIGLWTCHVFMIFQLERPDVLPTGDFGVQKAFNAFFNLTHEKKPTPAEMERLSDAWRPYRSYASYYMWKLHHARAPDQK